MAGDEPTDALLRGTWELTNRQAAVVGAFMANTGVSADRLTVAGRGARHPRASNLTAAGRAENRRVEISLVKRSDAPTQRHEPAQATADQAPID